MLFGLLFCCTKVSGGRKKNVTELSLRLVYFKPKLHPCFKSYSIWTRYEEEKIPPFKTSWLKHFSKNNCISDNKNNIKKKRKYIQSIFIMLNCTIVPSSLNKLDGVAPFITDPPPTSFTTLSIFSFFFLWHVTCDIWQQPRLHRVC